MSPRKIDLITNAIAGIRAIVLLGTFNGLLDMQQAVSLYFITGVITAFLDGKGIPSIGQVAREVQGAIGGSDRG